MIIGEIVTNFLFVCYEATESEIFLVPFSGFKKKKISLF